MQRLKSGLWIPLAVLLAAIGVAPHAQGDQLTCNLSDYKATPGLTASANADALTLTWDGSSEQLRLRLTVNGGTPTIQELAVRREGGTWATLATNLTPEFRVASGYRRMDQEALPAVKEAMGGINQKILDQYKWDAFWDAPLRVPGDEPAHVGSTPPPNGIPGTDQPGLPRKEEEIVRATATFNATGCEVKTDGQRLEVSFPGVELGVFAGRLQFTVYKGTNLIRQEVIAKTEKTSVAYKYDAGVKGVAIQPASKLVWRDTANLSQEYRLDAPPFPEPSTVRAANRLLAAQLSAGSIATFPPPHNFFWTREISVNLGYNWYRKDSDSSYSFGIRQAESEEDPAYAGRGAEDRRQNFALYSARPGTWQRMPVYLLIDPGDAQAALQSALAYTRDDHYKPLPGYMVMAAHFHTGMVGRLKDSGSLNNVLPDLELARSAGVNIFEPIDGGFGGQISSVPRERAALRELFASILAHHVENLADYYEAARLHSSKDFIVLPAEEVFGNIGKGLGGHNDFLPSHPVYWTQTRDAGQPFVEDDPKYGKVYHVGSPADMIEMMHRENALLFMPHPRTKGSAGYPDAIKDTEHFKDANYRGVGFRWGMGIDRSEKRLSDYRCMPLFDDMNNWVADLPTPPKYMEAITETYQQGPGDDFYANNPVSYIRVHGTPTASDWSPIIDALKSGDYFVSSGEVLIPSYAVQGTGSQRTILADVEWTFPLEFAEVVWGDGQKTDRQIISLTDLPAFGKQHFEIPFDTMGKKWVRFAVWDSAGNGAFVQPIKLNQPQTPTAEGQ